MRTETREIYQFAELDESAKDRARDHWREHDTEIAWSAENRQSMEAFADVFPIKVKNWSYGGRGAGVDFAFNDDDIENLSGRRLAAYIWNNYQNEIFGRKWFKSFSRPITDARIYHPCLKYSVLKSIDGPVHWYEYRSRITREAGNCVFTGYCMDDTLLDQVYAFLNDGKDERDFRELLADCFDAWIKACESEIEYQSSDEYIDEMLEINSYEFDEDGNTI